MNKWIRIEIHKHTPTRVLPKDPKDDVKINARRNFQFNGNKQKPIDAFNSGEFVYMK